MCTHLIQWHVEIHDIVPELIQPIDRAVEVWVAQRNVARRVVPLVVEHEDV